MEKNHRNHMIISFEKHFEKIQSLFMIKILRRAVMKGTSST
jgi:hypothetical protein